MNDFYEEIKKQGKQSLRGYHWRLHESYETINRLYELSNSVTSNHWDGKTKNSESDMVMLFGFELLGVRIDVSVLFSMVGGRYLDEPSLAKFTINKAP